MFLEISQNYGLNFIKKETLAQVFSCEFCEIAKNAFLTEHLRWLLLILVPTDALFLVNFLFLISYFFCVCEAFQKQPPEVFYKKRRLLRNFADWSLFSLEKQHRRSCFPVSFAKFLRTICFVEQLQWLFLSFFMIFGRWIAKNSQLYCSPNTRNRIYESVYNSWFLYAW